MTGYFVGVLVGFAILGSAPVNPYRMRNRRLGMLLAVAAGPVSNLILAVLFAIPFRLFPSLLLGVGGSGELIPTAEYILYDMVRLNLVLFVFNLLPLYPLDGWTVLLAAFPPEWAVWWQRNQQNSMYVLIGLVALSFLSARLPLPDVLGMMISTPVVSIMQFLFGL